MARFNRSWKLARVNGRGFTSVWALWRVLGFFFIASILSPLVQKTNQNRVIGIPVVHGLELFQAVMAGIGLQLKEIKQVLPSLSSRCQGRSKTRPGGRSKSRPLLMAERVDLSGSAGGWSGGLRSGLPGRV